MAKARRELNKLLTREEILDCQDLKIERLDVPEWGGYVYVRSMTASERDAWEGRLIESKNKVPEMRSMLASELVCDENGKGVFTPDDLQALGRKSGAALDRVFDKVQQLNKVSEKDLEELAGN